MGTAPWPSGSPSHGASHKSAVLLDRSDLDAWLATRFSARGAVKDLTVKGTEPSNSARTTLREGIRTARELRDANQALTQQISQSIRLLTERCDLLSTQTLEVPWCLPASAAGTAGEPRQGNPSGSPEAFASRPSRWTPGFSPASVVYETRHGTCCRRSILSAREAPRAFRSEPSRPMTAVKRRPKTPAPKQPPPKAEEAAVQAGAGPAHSHRFPIVGIGASAGGLEAATSMFKELSPVLGMAYVLVLHLDPARESAVTEILARATRMPVLQVKEGMRVAPDHVYVIPPNCEMTIAEWVLHLGSRKERRSSNTTIDTFLRSLAMAHGSDAIGVILSGTASDGTHGLAAIKGEAGIAFAQEPTSAKYDGMPASAIASGCVDFMMTPTGIAREIARIRHHPYIADGHKQDRST